jgi:hypothetical protein
MVKFVEEKVKHPVKHYTGYMVLGRGFPTKRKAIAYGKKALRTTDKRLHGFEYAKVDLIAIGDVKRLKKVS